MSITCKKCGSEIDDESKFCKNCGYDLSKDLKVNKGSKKNKKLKIILPIAFVIIGIAAVVVFMYLNDPVINYEKDIKSNKFVEASTLYTNKIENNKKNKQRVLTYLKSELDKVKQDFKNKKITYQQALSKLSAIDQTKLLNNVAITSEYINRLNNSRIAFNKGKEYEKSNDLWDAIKYYRTVIIDDSNFSGAAKKATELTAKYKTQTLKTAEDYANNKDYQNAINTIDSASSILDKDPDFEAKKAVYTTQLISKYKSDQQVIVLSAQVVSESDNDNDKSQYPDMLQAIIKNNSSKTIKDFLVGWLGYDSNNNPVNIKPYSDGTYSNYEFFGKAENVNMLPNSTMGDDRGWKLAVNHGLSKVIACVKSVTFTDGTTWENPYYQYWLDQYKGKYFSN